MFDQKPLPGDLLDYGCSLSDGLVGFWPMGEDNNSKKVFDLSGSNLTGTLAGNAHFVAGKYGSAINCDGSGDWVDVAHNPVFDFGTGDFSGVVYARNTEGTYFGLLSHHHNPGWSFYWMGSNGSDNMRLAVEATYKNSGVAVTFDDGLWHPLGFSKQGDNVYFYYDGLPSGSNSGLSGKSATSTDVLRIGALSYASAEILGDISHAYIWGRTLSASEHALLCREPFCMVRTRRRRIIYDEIAAAGLSIPIVAHHYKMLKAS